MRYTTWLVRVVLAGALAFGVMSCGDGDDDDVGSEDTPSAVASPTAADEDAAAVEKTVRDAIAAWNAKDVDTFVAAFTDQGLLSTFGEPGIPLAEVVAGLNDFIGDGLLSEEEFSSTEVSGTSATVQVTWISGYVWETHEFTLVDEAGAWKISADDQLQVETPDGLTEVSVDLNEFAFGFAADDIPQVSAFAFKANNVGQQQHEIALARIPADADIQELLMTEEDVPGFVFYGGSPGIAAGETGALVLAQPLEAGRYVMVCFFPDTAGDDTPHAFKGMTAEFTIP